MRSDVEPLIAVTSRSFSSSPRLRALLTEEFATVRFNDLGARLQGDSLVEFLQGATGAIVGIEKLDHEIISQLSRLRLVSKFGVGLDSIDADAMRSFGIRLAHTQGTNSEAVAELSLLLMLGCLRRIPEMVSNVLSENWQPLLGRLLHGKTIGLVGLGNVGKSLVELLRPFQCIILGFDISENRVEGVTNVGLTDLLTSVDVLCIHVPLTSMTQGMIGSNELELMSPDAVVINTSRGGIIDEAALLGALNSNKLAGAGLDVFESEPPVSWELVNHPKVFATPHIAGTSKESNMAMGIAAIKGLVDNLELLRG